MSASTFNGTGRVKQVHGLIPSRTPSNGLQRRVTKEDIRRASLRRWNGRARITTDWINVFHEPELCFSDGDLLVYLREPGKSSHGPAFRVHQAQLRDKGFDRILQKCVVRAPLSGVKCLMTACPGCEKHQPPSEIYMPAPASVDIDTIFDHHITTRNFFAWLYDLPLAGRTLGQSLIALKDRINFYRLDTHSQTSQQIISYAESQKYLDFRECVDHALAALALAESLELEDLWIDAFAHCVGMNDRSPHTSIEYPIVSHESRVLVARSRLELESRLSRVSDAVENFFEHDLSGNFLGLSQPARDHFDHFRSWLHSYYIEQHGFWPPVGFKEYSVQRSVFATMYLDFRNLYHHLVDNRIRDLMQDSALTATGGVCTLQNIQAFDARHKFETLSTPLPMLPIESSQGFNSKNMRRQQSWNPLTKRKMERDYKKSLQLEAVIEASNRDWQLMNCLLVRRYSEFEAKTIQDESEKISMVDGRKIRWILIYAILQTLISIMQAPSQVRNTEGLTYSLCCQPPRTMPWQKKTVVSPAVDSRRGSCIEPDQDFTRSHHAELVPQPKIPRSTSRNDRHQPMPTRVNSTSSLASGASTSSSIRRLVSRRNTRVIEVPASKKSAGFCEILVEGYGNGLNEVNLISSPSTIASIATRVQTPSPSPFMTGALKHTPVDRTGSDTTLPGSVGRLPDLRSSSSASVSRESSNASHSSSTWSKNSSQHDSSSSGSDAESSTILKESDSAHAQTTMSSGDQPVTTKLTKEVGMLTVADTDDRPLSKELNQVFDEHGFMQTLRINTKAWDDFLCAV